MSSAVPALWVRWRCPHRIVILAVTTAALLCGFWFLSRYPQLVHKANTVGGALPSMAFGSEVLHVDPAMPWWQRIPYTAVNWLDGMKIGMSFGVAFGALLHTVLRYYPLKIGSNFYLNSMKGALVGVPAGVCANCAVPVACGVTRGHGRVEVALGFLFSSPNLNPLVVAMTFAALPLGMAITKYAIVAFTIVILVPAVVSRLAPVAKTTSFDLGDAACELPASCDDAFVDVARQLARELAKNIWMLAKPTLVIMLGASLACAVLLELLPWHDLLAHTSPLYMLLVATIATAIPVPIALDVMFAALLLQRGAAPGYVMLFLMTLGIYSVVPTIYLWREVSRTLAVTLFVFFVMVGWICGLAF